MAAVLIKEADLKERKDFGTEFKRVRMQNGLKMEQMTKLMGISLEAGWRIERGYVSPNVPNLKSKLERIRNRKILVIS